MSSNLAGCANDFNNLDQSSTDSNWQGSAECPRNEFTPCSPLFESEVVNPIVTSRRTENTVDGAVGNEAPPQRAVRQPSEAASRSASTSAVDLCLVHPDNSYHGPAQSAAGRP